MAYVQSFGAAKVVTGSAHLITFENGKKILIDCGMFQGESSTKNIKKFDFDASEIDYLIFTHAHLDHVGRAPLLFKNGFRGKVVSTQATFELAHIIMLDSAHLMKQEYETKFRKAQRINKQNRVKQALYTPSDVESFNTLQKISAKYKEKINLGDEISISFFNAGHILGSSFVKIEYVEKELQKSIVFSGDLGNKSDFVLPEPLAKMSTNTLYIESTYGDRIHKNIEQSIEEFKNIILKTLGNGGNVLIPSFAIERTQEILCLLKEMHDKKELPSSCRVFLDSPMAIRATSVYNERSEELSLMCQEFMKRDGAVFDFKKLIYTHSIEDSKKINDIDSGVIIIAGSGMCTGGRILHHFKHRIWSKRNSVLFVGYQAHNTLGRKIVEGAKFIKLYNEKIKIKASIHTINGFSAHADQEELITWIQSFGSLDNIYLIHGEEDKQKIFKKAIKKELGRKSHIVEMAEKIYI